MKFYISFFGEYLLKSDKNNEYLIWRSIYIYDTISQNSFRMRNVSHRICRVNQKTHFVCSNSPPHPPPLPKCPLWDNMAKYGRARQATDDNIIHRKRGCTLTHRSHYRWLPYILEALEACYLIGKRWIESWQLLVNWFLISEVTICPSFCHCRILLQHLSLNVINMH